MQIQLTETQNGSKQLVFPSLPERVSISGNAKFQTYDLLSIGTVKMPKGTEVGTISWDGIFFGYKRRRSRIIQNAWIDPKDCKYILEEWRDNGVILRLLVTGTAINYDVIIESFSGEYYGAFGDFKYSISFLRYKEIKLYTTDELSIAAKIASRPATTEQSGGTYTVTSGDNLWKIAQNKLGAGSRWAEIYSINQEVIEASAKKRGKSSSNNGHWIYPGDVYTLPAT